MGRSVNRCFVLLGCGHFTSSQSIPVLLPSPRIGAPLFYVTKTSTEPSLSKSPNAKPRLEMDWEKIGPLWALTFSNLLLSFRNNRIGLRYFTPSTLLSTMSSGWPLHKSRSRLPSLSESKNFNLQPLSNFVAVPMRWHFPGGANVRTFCFGKLNCAGVISKT